MSQLSRNQKQSVLRDASFCCHYCDEVADTVDHKTPLSSSGKNVRENLVAACQTCNAAKGTLGYELFKRYVRRFGRRTLGRRWYMGTNAYTDKAIAKILCNCDFQLACNIVLRKFAGHDHEKALRLLRRGARATRFSLDTEMLNAFARQRLA